MSRVILHCDMNNFYASVECLYDENLKNKDVIVCGKTEERHGIVLSKNESAKRKGVKTGDTIWEAKRKCPGVITIEPHFERYVIYSQKAMDIYKRYTDRVEMFGMDECWLDVTGSIRLFGSGKKIADEIRNCVRNELGLTVSVGVSFNKVFAKLGSDLKKPDATTVIDEANYKNIIYDLPASSIIGIGPATSANMHRIGVDTIGELAVLPVETMIRRLGKHGEKVWRYANGLDNSPVMHADEQAAIKSIGRGITANRDLVNDQEVKLVMYSLSRRVAENLRRHNLSATGVQITIKDNNLISRDYQCPLSVLTNNAVIIYNSAYELFKARYDWAVWVRAVTVRAINLVSSDIPSQIDFIYNSEFIEKKEKIDAAEDGISLRFGKDTLKPMSLLRDLHIPQSHSEEIILPGFRV